MSDGAVLAGDELRYDVREVDALVEGDVLLDDLGAAVVFDYYQVPRVFYVALSRFVVTKSMCTGFSSLTPLGT